MFRIVACDDSPAQFAALEDAVRRALPDKEFEWEAFSSVADLFAAQAAGRTSDILLLDIRMPEQDGISVARECNRVSPATQIIFISAYTEYALDVYEAEHIYFLTKPVRQERLAAALSRAFERLKQARSARISLFVRGGAKRIVQLHEICFFERQNHVTHVALAKDAFETLMKLSEIEQMLPPDTFARPHNSYLVNLSQVRATTRYALTLRDGSELPISNQKRVSFMEALARSL